VNRESAPRVDADVARDLRRALDFIAAGVLLAIAVNWILPLIDWKTLDLRMPQLLPPIHPVGRDFRVGVLYPAQGLLAGSDPYRVYGLVYPPATLLIGLAFNLLPADQAYLADVVLILFACVAAVWISARMAVASADGFAELPQSTAGTVGQALFLSAAMLNLLSYGLIFAVERGNFDAQAMLLAIVGVWMLVNGKGGVVGPVLLLSLAAHMKVYPGVLLLLVPWKHGWRTLPLILGVNAILLLVTGWGNGLAFLERMALYAADPSVWIGNHSAASFGRLVADYSSRHGLPLIPGWVFYALPLLVWGIGVVFLVRRGPTARNTLFFVALSIPLMNLVPSTSHDYKLVIVGAAMVILLVRLMEVAVTRGIARAMPALALLLLLMIWMGRSYTMLPAILGNKYPALLLFQALILAVVIGDGSGRPRRARLRLLRPQDYPGAGRNDPIRFYTSPFFGGLYRRRVELCLEALPGGGRILEVGFGSGVAFANLAELYDEIWGIDPSVDVEAIQAFWQAKGIRTKLRQGSVLALPFPDGHFDAVLLISHLEHLRPETLAAAFAEVARTLKPGGSAVYGVPVERRFMRFMYRLLGYDIRGHHFSTETDVRRAAARELSEVRAVEMPGMLGIPRNIYQVGHFRKERQPPGHPGG
jgi:SAM-dependent methyltransferase